MSTASEWRVARVGRWSIPVIPAVIAASLAGLLFGVWLGTAGPRAPAAAVTPSPTPSPTVGSATTSPTTAPSAAATVEATPTATPPPPTTSPATPAAGTGTLVEMEGDGDGTSPPFTVEPGWQLEWQVDGTRFVAAISGDDVTERTIVDQPGPATGVTAPVGAGTFTLTITAEGSWRIRVVQP